METCSSALSTRVKQRVVIEFLTAEKVTPTEIHRRLKAVYGDDAIDRSTVNRWAIEFYDCEPGKAINVDEKHSGRPITATEMNIANSLTNWFKMTGESNKSVSQTILEYRRNALGFIIEQLAHTSRLTVEALRNLTFEPISHPP